MYPPVARNDRECTADWEDESGQFGGIAFRRGTKIRFPLYVLHHNPQYWPEPDIFRPERFLPENVGNIVTSTATNEHGQQIVIIENLDQHSPELQREIMRALLADPSIVPSISTS